MDKLLTSHSSIERLNSFKNSNLDNRVKTLHTQLTKQLGDPSYDGTLGYTYKIARVFSDFEILSAAEYCARKASHPGRAFVSLFEKKIAARSNG